jgi:hypothetical protein
MDAEMRRGALWRKVRSSQYVITASQQSMSPVISNPSNSGSLLSVPPQGENLQCRWSRCGAMDKLCIRLAVVIYIVVSFLPGHGLYTQATSYPDLT